MNRSLLYIHLAVFLWGFTGILGKTISFSAPILVGYRMLFTCLILAILITMQKQWQKFSKKDFATVAFVGALFAIHWICFFMSVKLANASIAMLCLATASVFIAFLQPLIYKKPFNPKELLFGGISLLGVLCIYAIQPEGTGQNGMVDFGAGVIYGVIAAILSAVFTIFNKPLSTKYKPLPTLFWEMFFGFALIVVLFPFLFANELPNISLPNLHDGISLLALALFCTVMAQALALKALKQLDAFTVVLTVNLEPIYGMALAFLVYQENQQLNWGSYLGITLILLSLGLQAFNNRRKNRVLA